MKRWLITIISVVVVLAVAIYGLYRIDLTAPMASDQAGQQFDITAGQKPTTIAANLEQANLIRNRTAFLWFISVHGLRDKLQAGSYTLQPSYSAEEVADIISSGKVDNKRLVVPEGTTLAKVRELAAAKGIKNADFDAAVAQNYGKDFLLGRPPNVSLEGYLFPDSYQVTSTTTASALVQTMLDDFDRRVSPDLRQAFTAEGLTLHQGITLASMVEKEVSNPADRPIVAQIFLNRLKAGQMLQSDVTVDYGASLLGVPFDTNLNSPYNTYRVKGLPLGPICNPGLAAIIATAHPQPTDYLYFVAGKDGTTHFARTYAEHQQNVAKYLK